MDDVILPPHRPKGRLLIEELPNGYWSATLTIGPLDYSETKDLFHDYGEALLWADQQYAALTVALGDQEAQP